MFIYSCDSILFRGFSVWIRLATGLLLWTVCCVFPKYVEVMFNISLVFAEMLMQCVAFFSVLSTLNVIRSSRFSYTLFLSSHRVLCQVSLDNELLKNPELTTVYLYTDKILVSTRIRLYNGGCSAVTVHGGWFSAASCPIEGTCSFGHEHQLNVENVNVSSSSCIQQLFFFLGTIHLYKDTRGFVLAQRDLALSIGIKNKSLLMSLLYCFACEDLYCFSDNTKLTSKNCPEVILSNITPNPDAWRSSHGMRKQRAAQRCRDNITRCFPEGLPRPICLCPLVCTGDTRCLSD